MGELPKIEPSQQIKMYIVANTIGIRKYNSDVRFEKVSLLNPFAINHDY